MTHNNIPKPSTKIISLGIIVIAIVTATILLKTTPQPSVEQKKGVQVRQPIVQNTVNETDTDGDGLRDWEEVLWGTDPAVADTDGDGISDKEWSVQYELQQEQERKTTLEEVQKILTEQKGLLDSGEITASEAASRGLIAQYFLFKESGLPITEQSVATFTQGLTQNAVQPTIYTTYSKKDVLISPVNGASAVKVYGNSLGAILNNVVDPEVPHELLVFVQFEQTKDLATFQAQMKTIDSRYEYTITNMLNMYVPKDIAPAHLNLLNALSKTRADLQKMALLSGDAVGSMLAFKNYETNSANIAVAFAQMRTIFNTMHVIFNTTDSGYVLVAQPDTSTL